MLYKTPVCRMAVRFFAFERTAGIFDLQSRTQKTLKWVGKSLDTWFQSPWNTETSDFWNDAKDKSFGRRSSGLNPILALTCKPFFEFTYISAPVKHRITWLSDIEKENTPFFLLNFFETNIKPEIFSA